MAQDGAMPQPEFHGIFWQPGKRQDHIILEWPGEEVCAWLAEIPGEDPAFLIGGACLDLRRNGHADKAEGLMAAAKTRWPEFRWDFMEKTIGKLLDGMPPPTGNVPPTVSALLYGTFEMASAITKGELPMPGDPV